MAMSFFASCLSAVVTALVTHPIDTLKCRLQTGMGVGPNPDPTALSALRYIVAHEGFLALYQGLPVTLLFTIPALSLYLFGYDLLVPWISLCTGLPPGGLVVSTLSATLAEVVSAIFWTPMEIVKTRQQIASVQETSASPNEQTPLLSDSSSSSNVRQPYVTRTEDTVPLPVAVNKDMEDDQVVFASAWTHFTEIYRKDGICGFFVGYWLGLAVFVPQSVVFFVAYEKLKSIMSSLEFSCRNQPLDPTATSTTLPDCHFSVHEPYTRQLGFWDFVFCSALASALSALVCNFIDVIKTRWQARIYIPSTRSTPIDDDESLQASQTEHHRSSTHVVITASETDSPESPTVSHLQSTRLMDAIRTMFLKESGVTTFFRGVVARVAWAISYNVISFTIYEMVKGQ